MYYVVLHDSTGQTAQILFCNSMLDPIKVADNCLVAACALKLPMIGIVILIVILGMKQTIIFFLFKAASNFGRKAQTH